MQGTEIGRDEEIRQLAYRFWQEDGCPDGQEVQHWLKAESIWLEEHRPKGEPQETKPFKRTQQPKQQSKSLSAKREL